jgi:hypothetical protein
MRGRDRERPIEAGERFVGLPELMQDRAEHLQRIDVIGFDGERFATERRGFGRGAIAPASERSAKEVVDRRHRGILTARRCAA